MKNHPITLAIDRTSVRTKDVDGRLHVELTPISKAMVCPYYGHEIPDSEKLGLDQNKIYQLFRDPAELQRAASTFNNTQLLQTHQPVSADEPAKELTVGSTGTDAVFIAPYLKNSLVVWDAEAIAGIESGQIEQLSAGYYYTADMTPGEYQGQAYDGVMRNITGNHIALVERGRAGPDVVVADADPFFNATQFDEGNMKKSEKRRLKIAQNAAIKKIAQDSGLSDDLMAKLTEAFVLAMDEADKEEEEEEAAKKKAMDEEEAKAKAKEEEAKKLKAEEEEKNKGDKAAMDSAMVDQKVKMAIDANNRMHQALKDVEPLVGEVKGMDSAEAIYQFALKQAGIDTTDVHPSAYRTLVTMHKQAVKTNGLAEDKAINYDIASAFKGLDTQLRRF